MARKYLKAYMDWQGWKLLVRPTDKFLFVLCVLVIVGCVPDPGRIRLRYPNDFGFITGYFDRQQSTGYWEVQQIELVNNYIVLASRDIRGGNIIIHLLDVKNPYSPQELASYESILTKIDDMQVVDNYVVLAGRLEGIEIIDVSNLTRPVRADQYKHTNGLATPMVIVNHYLYYYVPEGAYSSPTPRWHILDISSPQQIRFVGEVFDLYEPMAVSDHYILATRRVNNTAASLFQIIDVVDNTAPVALSEIRIESLWVYGIEVRDDLAYVSAGSGLRILDISDPYVPTMIRDDLTLIGSFAHMDMADNIIVGDFIFALEIELQGQSVDIVPLARLNIEKFMETFCGSDISLPNYSGEVKTVLCSVPSASFDQAPNDIAIANGYVYVASNSSLSIW